MSFRREKFVPFGGPNGGNGGHGGDVYLVGNGGMTTLRQFRYHRRFSAQRGAHGKGKGMHGSRGEDLLIEVPLGTMVARRQDDGTIVPIADVVEEGQRVLVAKGGKGGFGNAHFATPTNQAPRVAQNGTPGEDVRLVLDLKLIADAGIVGYPNAGKSTLLSTVSRARPKIAPYPFTTTEPVLGVVEIGYQSFVLAEIPGIIEGAHEGRGLGLDFLRHIERTRVLISLVDGMSPDPVSDLAKVEEELALYDAGLRDKPRVIAVNKIDVPEVRARLPQLEREFRALAKPVYFISAATGEGIEALMMKCLELLWQAEAMSTTKREQAEFKVFRPRPLSPRRSGQGEVGRG